MLRDNDAGKESGLGCEDGSELCKAGCVGGEQDRQRRPVGGVVCQGDY